MRTNKFSRYGFLFLFVFIVGCGTALPTVKPYKLDVQQGNMVTSKMLLQLRPGMSKSQVKYIMGTPLVQDSFHGNRWDYFYQMREHGKVTEQRRVVLDFEGDTLKAVRGDVAPTAAEQAAESKNTGIRSLETAGKTQEKSWWDKLQFWKKDEAETVAKADIMPAPTPEKAAPLVVMPAVDISEKIDVAETKPIEEPPSTQAQAISTQIAPSENVPTPPAKVVDTRSEAADVAIGQMVDTWAQAWRTKNVVEYLAVYSDSFKPQGMSKNAWVAQRKQRLSAKQGDIRLEISQLKMDVQDKKATAIFVQNYRAKTISDQVTKQLDLVLNEKTNRWQITKETVLSKMPVAVLNAPSATVQLSVAPAPAPENEADSNIPAIEGLKPVDLAGGSDTLSLGAKEQAYQMVQDWASAWRNKNVEQYLAFYAQDFKPEGKLSKQKWEAQRKDRLSAQSGEIQLKLDDVQVNVYGKRAVAQFVQTYQSKTFGDKVTKQLDLVLDDISKQWFIVKESAITGVVKPALENTTAIEEPAPTDTVEKIGF